jgi:hypothetical protein
MVDIGPTSIAKIPPGQIPTFAMIEGPASQIRKHLHIGKY